MPRCKQCLTKAEAENGHCPVCGIVQDKKFGNLSPEERKNFFHARGIRFVAMVHLFGAGCGVILLPFFPVPFALVLLIIINILMSLGLDRYAHAAYKAATIYYFFLGMVSVISIQHGSVYLGGIAWALIALYLIGNGTSKAIFERRAKELLAGT